MPHTIGWDENAIGGLDHLARGRVSFRRSLDVERAGAVQQDNPSPFSSHNLVELSIHRAQARDYQVKKPEIFERVIEFIEGKMMPLWFSTVWCVNVFCAFFDFRSQMSDCNNETASTFRCRAHLHRFAHCFQKVPFLQPDVFRLKCDSTAWRMITKTIRVSLCVSHFHMAAVRSREKFGGRSLERTCLVGILKTK